MAVVSFAGYRRIYITGSLSFCGVGSGTSIKLSVAFKTPICRAVPGTNESLWFRGIKNLDATIDWLFEHGGLGGALGSQEVSDFKRISEGTSRASLPYLMAHTP